MCSAFRGARSRMAAAPVALIVISASCGDLLTSADTLGQGDSQEGSTSGGPETPAVFLVIDEESIDNGNPPNDFSDVDVNDQLAEVGVREQLRFFGENVDRTIELFTGDVGDEGWHAVKTIPSSWRETGPTDNGTRNYLRPGPGLGAAHPDDDREVLLDKIPNVTPLRATGQAMLVGQTVCAVVYDSDVSINYSPLTGNLMGANLGIVAFDVLEVRERRDGSTSSLPRATIRIRDADDVCAGPLALFANAPAPESSGEPFDIRPPDSPPSPTFDLAP